MVGVVPCAGLSARMGRSKALLDADGAPFLRRVVDALRAGGCDRVLAVVRRLDGPEAALAREVGAEAVLNPDPEDGPISSIRAALEWLEDAPSGIVVLPVDHPRVAPETVAALIDAARGTSLPIVLPRFGDRRGHPAVFKSEVFPELADPTLQGGARTVVRRDAGRVLEVSVGDPGVLDDIDDPSAYRASFGASPVPGEMGPAGAAGAILSALEFGHPVVAVTRLDPVPLRRVVVFQSRDTVQAAGSLGSSSLDGQVDELAREVLQGERPEGRAEAAGAALYLELHHPRPQLVIVGAGHIAQPLSTVGALLGYDVTVADDRPDFATQERFPHAHRVVRVDFSDPFAEIEVGPLTHLVLVTRGHKYDYECLRLLLRSDDRPRYVGMIGSRRRVRATFEQLVAEGIPRDRIAAVRAPVGLDLGAETPQEIAVSVAAEMILEWRGGSGAPLHRVERVLERFLPGDEG